MGKRRGSSKIRLETVWCGAEFDWESVGVDPVLFGNLLVLSKISLGECACRATFDWKLLGPNKIRLQKLWAQLSPQRAQLGFFYSCLTVERQSRMRFPHAILVYSIYVCDLCMQSLYAIIVCNLCMQSLYAIFVCHFGMQSL